jgi:hypothetical protein
MSAGTKSMFEILILVITLLANRLNLNSTNSSKPPSSDPNVDCHAILPKQCHGILSVANEHSKKVDEKGKGLAAPSPFDSRQQSTAPDYPLTPESPRVRLRFIRF